jgi:hypothetical protein
MDREDGIMICMGICTRLSILASSADQVNNKCKVLISIFVGEELLE